MSVRERDPASRVSPRVIEAEDGFGELVLLQHVLHQRVETADGNARVSHAQNPIEFQVVKGAAGLIQAQTELLVPDDNVLDLEGEERHWEMSAFGTFPFDINTPSVEFLGRLRDGQEGHEDKSALRGVELFPITDGGSLALILCPITLIIS